MQNEDFQVVSNRCGRCHRALRNLDAMKVGYGPTCYRKVFNKPMPRSRNEANTELSSRPRKRKRVAHQEHMETISPLVIFDIPYTVLDEGIVVSDVAPKRLTTVGGAFTDSDIYDTRAFWLNALAMYVGDAEAYSLFSKNDIGIVDVSAGAHVLAEIDVTQWIERARQV